MTSFQCFDWTDERWQRYFSDLYPTPPAKSVLKWKKKWYHRNIDKNFDPNLTLPEEIEVEEKTPPPSRPSTYVQSSEACSAGACFLHLVSLALIIPAVLPLAISQSCGSLSRLIVAVACCSDLLRFMGRPKLAAEWWRKAFYSENSEILLFIVFTALLPFSLPLAIPQALSAILRVSVFYVNAPPFVRNIKALATLDRVYHNKRQILQFRSDIELTLILLPILSLFSQGFQGLVRCFLYFHFLRCRYWTNSYSRVSLSKLKGKVEVGLAKGYLPGFITRTLRRLLSLF